MLDTFKSDEGKPSKSITEKEVQLKVSERYGGLREVPCVHGRIDVLTVDTVIEVKIAREWKHAVGQVLVYGQFFTTHKLVVALYNAKTTLDKQAIEDSCTKLGVSVIWLDAMVTY